MFENRFSLAPLKWDTKALILVGAIILCLFAVSQWDDVANVSTEALVEGQEYAISDLLEKQRVESEYLLREDGTLIMSNIYLSQMRDGSSMLTATTYFPQLVLVASYGSNEEMLEEQVMMGVKYPNVPAENPAKILYPMFGIYEELEIQAYAVELSLPQGTETIKIYSG
ncbi:MAG: hypothetical protein U9P70_02990 [Patescibacteria group bacterium]|nr:hypothetical protein [Patescibacteria group bacterium]